MLITPMSCSTSSAAIVSGRMRLSAKATSSGNVRVEVVADHEHVHVLGQRVHRVRPRRVRRRRQDVGMRRDGDDVRRMPATGALGVVGVDRAAGDRPNGVFEEAGLVQRVGVDRKLHVVLVGDAQAGVDHGRRRAPVLVHLEAAGAGLDLLAQRRRASEALPLASRPQFTGSAIRGAQHAGRCARVPACTSSRACRPPGRCRRRAAS